MKNPKTFSMDSWIYSKFRGICHQFESLFGYVPKIVDHINIYSAMLKSQKMLIYFSLKIWRPSIELKPDHQSRNFSRHKMQNYVSRKATEAR